MLNFINLLKSTQQNKNTVKVSFETKTKNYWDATNGLNLSTIKINSLDIFSKYEKLKQDPKIISRQKRNGIIIGITRTIILLILTTIIG
jgi:hypothetical protein